MDAKYVKNWSRSIYNPDSHIWDKAFASRAQSEVLDQARDYCERFEGGVIYYTNSVEFAEYYTKLFKENGLKKFKFVIAPVEYE